MAKCSVIILGNPGAGKSLLGNITLGEEVFEHGISATSVTNFTESKELKHDSGSMIIYNIPGLIEVNQERIISNKKEIERAFAEAPHSVVMFVFRNVMGRPINEDITAFRAIHKAYAFHKNAVLLVVNNVAQNQRESNYEGKILTMFQNQLQDIMAINRENLLILNALTDIQSPVERDRIRERIIQALIRLRPAQHIKINEIEVSKDELEKMTNKIKEKEAQFAADRQNYESQIQESQRRIDEMERKAAEERASLEQQTQQRAEELAKQIEEKNELLEKYRREAEEYRKKFHAESQRDDQNVADIHIYRKRFTDSERKLHTLTKDFSKVKQELEELKKKRSAPFWEQLKQFYRTVLCSGTSEPNSSN